MSGFADAVDFGGHGRQTHEHVAGSRFAARIGVAVKQSEQQGADAAVGGLTAEEHPFPGNENIVEDQRGIGISVGKSTLDLLFRTDIVERQNVFDAFVISGHGKRHGIVLLVRPQGPGGNDHDLVRDGAFRDMHLAPPHHDAVFFLFHDPQIRVRVALLGGPFQAFTLDVGLRAGTDQIVTLEVFQPFEKVLVVLGGALVGFVRLI